MSYILKVGGSLLFNELGEVNVQLINQYIRIIKEYKKVKGIIIGGGTIARKYINAAKFLNANESMKDLLGIDISRVNSRLFIIGLGDIAYPIPVKTLEEVMIANSMGKVAVLGGFIPGQSTTTVALEVAEAMNAENILILTDVDGIFNKNPKKYHDAKKYEKISIDELEQLILTMGDDNQAAAGEYRIFDALSIQIFKRGNFSIKLINGRKIEDCEQILKGEIYNSKVGTLITK